MELIKFTELKREYIARYIRTETTPGHALEGHILINENIHQPDHKRLARWIDPTKTHVWWVRTFVDQQS